MINFFRRFRKQLLSENKFSKYFIYALGEIILVVIGILIALQINTWKENKQKTKIENQYLNGIVTNIEQDILELDNLLKRDTITFNAYTNILLPFKNGPKNLYSQSFIRTIGDAQFTHHFDGNSIVFEDMKSSGKINYINSDALRFALLEYYNTSQSFANTHKTNNVIINQFKDEAFTDNIDLNSLIEMFLFSGEWSAQLDNLDLSFFNKDKTDDSVKRFANRISMMKGVLKVNHSNNEHLIEKAKGLKTLITDYLNGKNIDFGNYLPEETLSAIIEGNTTTLDKVVTPEDISACFDIENSYPINLLSLSIENNSFSAVRYLVEKGADIELVCSDKTPLMYAVKYGRLNMVEYLLKQGADINIVSVEGKTALDYAVNYRHPKIEAFLKAYNNN
jgi:hypothetical protein